jgi:hypothetical protein
MRLIGDTLLLLPCAMMAIGTGGCSKDQGLSDSGPDTDPGSDVDADSDADADADADTDTDADTDVDSDGDSDSDTCTTVPDPCIVHVNVAAAEPGCGLSWEEPFQRIQDGIDLASIGAGVTNGICQVWVAAGTYYIYETAETDTVRPKKNVKVYGGFVGDEESLEERDWVANPTILDGHAWEGSSERVWNVVFMQGPSPGYLDGFHITGGYSVPSTDTYRKHGAGVHADSWMQLYNCRLHGNQAVYGGGGWGTLRIFDSLVHGNLAQQGSAFYLPDPSTMYMKRCIVADNPGTAVVSKVNFTVADSVFVGNGAAISASTGMLSLGCTVSGNVFSAHDGGGYGVSIVSFSSDTGVDIHNNVMAGNDGSAISIEGNDSVYLGPRLHHNTIADNGGTGIEIADSRVKIVNNIVHGNAAGGLDADWSSEVLAFGNDIEGWTDLEQNIDADPLFRPVPEPATGTWENIEFDPVSYQTVLTDEDASWPDDALAGLFVQPSATNVRWYPIVGNTGGAVRVWGNATGGVHLGESYALHDLRLTVESPCVDSANGWESAPADFNGGFRWDAPSRANTGVGRPCWVDMGAFEYRDEPEGDGGVDDAGAPDLESCEVEPAPEPGPECGWTVEDLNHGINNAVWGDENGHIWVVGFHEPDRAKFRDGDSWWDVWLPDLESLEDVEGTDAENVYAVGSYTCILEYDGVWWKTIEYSIPGVYYGMWIADDGQVFAAGGMNTSARIAHFDGVDWTMKNFTGPCFFDIWGSSPEDVWAAGEYEIWHYDGLEWVAAETDSPYCNIRKLWGSSSDDIFAVCLSSSTCPILHYDGTSWSKMSCDSDWKLYGVWGTAPDNVYAVGLDGLIAHYDGSSWSEMEVPLAGSDDLMDIWGYGADDFYVLAHWRYLYHYSCP